jgi:hypothetical protein
MAIYKNHFYHGLIKSYTVVMGHMLDGIDVVRFKPDGTEDSRVRVPVVHSTKEKFIQRILSDESLARQPAIVLPRIAFELQGLMYNPQRKISGKHQFAYATSDNGTSSVYTPVPYDFEFTASIVAKTHSDALQIVEQIVPFFAPDYHVTFRGIGNPIIEYDVGITLDSVANDDSYSGELEDRRLIIWTLSFVVQGFLFGPVRNGSLIKTVDVSIFNMDELAKPAQNQEYLVNYNFVPYINGVPLVNIGIDAPWTVLETTTP